MGGVPTLLSYGVKIAGRTDPEAEEETAIAFRRALPESHLSFLESLVLSFNCGDYFFAHAGARPGIPLRQQYRQDLLWIRDDFLLHEEDFGKVVVHGHTPATEPEIRRNRINIDTGAYATGRLTCLVLEGDRMASLIPLDFRHRADERVFSLPPKPVNTLTQVKFRISILLFAAVLGLQSIWLLVIRCVWRPLSSACRQKFRCNRFGQEHDRAAWAAAIGAIRGELWLSPPSRTPI